MRGTVVVITGSTRGIGRALADALARAGALVVVSGRADADVSTADGARSLIARAIAEHGRIDVLVNNAAITAARRPIWELSAEEATDVLATNVNGALLCAREALVWAVPRGAKLRIVNVSSGVTGLPSPRAATPYVTSKHALEGLTRALAAEVAGTNVTVLALQLGAHRTELVRELWPADDFDRLPSPEAAVRALVLALGAPAENVHGRVLAAWRLEHDAAGESLLADPRVGLPPMALGGVDALAPTEDARYPEPTYRALREALATHHGLPAESFVVGAGATDLLDRALGLFARAGETIVANAPSWPLFPHLARAHGLAWKRVPYRREANRADHALGDLRAAIDASTRIVYLVSPSNPGGRALDRDAFVAFLDALPAHVTVVVDEAYIDFTTRPAALRAIELVGRPRLVVVRTFSKLHRLAAHRVGYAATTPELARWLERAAPPFAVAGASERAAVDALRDVERMARHRDEALRARERVAARLSARGVEWLESDAPFLYARTGEERTFLDGAWSMVPARDEEGELDGSLGPG